MEASSTTAAPEAHDLEGGISEEEAQKIKSPESIEEAADGRRLSGADQQNALDWLLADDDDEAGEIVKTLTINVGTPDNPIKIDWTIRAIERAEMRQIRSRAQSQQQGVRGRRRRQEGEQIDDGYSNLLVVTEATVYPDIREVARQKGIADPSLVVEHKFRRKPGLIDQVAAEVFLFSGWDEDDIQEAKEVRAAGN